MGKCAVSILVPICNVERYLGECLTSLLSQTLEDIQIICIDDGSTDSSPAILEEFSKRDSRIEVITKLNSGYGNSMNIGLSRARGEYVGILESDDFGEPDMFESLYRMAKENDADVVKSEFYYHKTGEDPSSDAIAGNMAGCYCGEPFAPLDHQEMFLMQPAIWSGLYRRSFLEENEIHFLETPGASFQDTSFNFKVFALAKRAYLTEKAFLHYRIDNANSSVKSQAKVFCICDEYKEMWSFVKQRPALMERLSKRLCFIQFGGYMWNLGRLTPALQPKFYERVVSEFQDLQSQRLLDEAYFNEASWGRLTELLADPEQFFAKNYGPKDVEQTFLLYVGQMGASSAVRAAEAVLDAAGPNDEVLLVSHPNNLKNVSNFEDLRSEDTRFFFEEVLDCCPLAKIDESRIRGKRLIVVGMMKTPSSIELGGMKEALKSGREWEGRCGHARNVDSFGSDGLSIPPVVPLLLQWGDEGVSAPLDVSMMRASGLLKDYSLSLELIDSAWDWLYSLKEEKGLGTALNVYRNVLIPLWGKVKESYDSLSFSDRIKVTARTPDILSAKYSINCGDGCEGIYREAPQISVLIPVYNAQEFMTECLASVYSQKGVSFEVICVDDGSTDSCLETLRAYQRSDSNLRVIAKLNGGAASARNLAMSAARGEYLAFIDPDDFYPTDSVLADLYNAAKANDANVCGGSFSCVNPDGSIEDEFDLESTSYVVKREGFRLFADDAFDYGWIRFIYRRSFIEYYDLCFPSLRWYEDPVFLVEVMKHAKEYYLIPEVVYRYRVDYREPDWTVNKVRDLLRGIGSNLSYAKEEKLGLLYSRLVGRLERDYLLAIEQNLTDEEVAYRLAKIQAELDPSLISAASENGEVFYLLAPYETLVVGGKPTAIVRLAKRAETSKLYKSVQHVREKFN